MANLDFVHYTQCFSFFELHWRIRRAFRYEAKNNKLPLVYIATNSYLCLMKHFVTIVFCVLLFNVSAQSLKEFHVTERSSDGTSVVQANARYPDNAMILVYSAMPNLSFRSSVGGINQQQYNARANRYEILVSPQRQILFVSAFDYIEQRIALINPAPKNVYYYEVEPRSGQDEVAVYFDVTPGNAKLFIENIPHPINTTTRVPKGEVSLRIEREGFRTIEQLVVISEEQVKYDFVMQEVDVVPLSIVSNVSEAAVVIDGKDRGQTDSFKRRNMFLFPGIYNIEVRKNGYISQIQTVEIFENKENVVDFELLKNTGTVEFVLIPANTGIKINREVVCGERIIELAPGTYRVDLEAEGHQSETFTLTIDRGETQVIHKQLNQQMGSIQATVSPSVAQVILVNNDGQEVERWKGIKLLNEVPVGEYTLEMSAPGFQSKRERIVVEEGERTVVDITLSESQSEVVTSFASPNRMKQSIDVTHVFQASVVASSIQNVSPNLVPFFGLRYTAFSLQDVADSPFGFFIEFNTTSNLFNSADYHIDQNGTIQGLSNQHELTFSSAESNTNLRSSMLGFGYSFLITEMMYLSLGAGFITTEVQYDGFISDEVGVISNDVTISKAPKLGDEWNTYYSAGVQFELGGDLYLGVNAVFATDEYVGTAFQLLLGVAL